MGEMGTVIREVPCQHLGLSLQGRRLQEIRGFSVARQHRVDICPQRLVAGTGFLQESGPPARLLLQGGLIQLLESFPALGIQSLPPRFIWPRSHTFAPAQSTISKNRGPAASRPTKLAFGVPSKLPIQTPSTYGPTIPSAQASR